MSVLMKCVSMITVQGLITRRIRYNRLHLLRCIWLFPTLGTNLSEWDPVRTRHQTSHHDENRSDKFVRNTFRINRILEMSWDNRKNCETAQFVSLDNTVYMQLCQKSASGMFRLPKFVLPKTYISAHHL